MVCDLLASEARDCAERFLGKGGTGGTAPSPPLSPSHERKVSSTPSEMALDRLGKDHPWPAMAGLAEPGADD